MRDFKINDNVYITVELYRNRHEVLCEIPLDFIENITYKFDDIDEIALKIPKYITKGGEKKFNHIYYKINTRQSLIVTTKNDNGEEKKQRFTLCNKKSVLNNGKGDKSFIAYSWEKTLERDRLVIDMLSRQLTNKDDNVNVGEGVLDLICKKTGWTVGYVDPLARTKTYKDIETFTNVLYSDLTVNNVTESGLIFNKNVSISVPANKPLYCTFYYRDVRIFDSGNNTIMTVNIQNTITDAFYTGIKNIKAYQYSEAGNRFGIKYVFTLVDNVEIIKTTTFTNCINKNINIDTLTLSYDYADVVEKTRVQYANFEAFNDSAYKYLKDIQEVFECHFEFDTINKVINTYANESLTENNGYILTLGQNVLNINTTEDESIPTVLQVESEVTSILEENPNGTQYIENYDYYIKNNLISDSLKLALEKYNVMSKKLLDEWNILKNEELQWTQKNTKVESEIKSLTIQIQGLTNILASYITAQDAVNQERIKAEIDGLTKKQEQLVILSHTYTTNINNIRKQIEINNSKVKKENITDDSGNKIFSKDDLLELSDMREVIQLTDNYFSTPYGLYNYAEEYLRNIAIPKISFDLNCVDLVQCIKNPRGWNNILKLGVLFPVEKNEILTEDEIRLIEMNLIPVKNTNRVGIKDIKFSNKMNDINKLRVGANVGRTTNKVTGKMTTFSELWEDSKMTNNFVGEMIEKGLSLNATNIRGGIYRNIFSITEAGQFIIDSQQKNQQLYLGSGILAITTDEWQHCKTAIDANGIIAETIIGHLILGEKLIITDEGGCFYIGNSDDYATSGEFGINLYDDLKSGRQRRIFLGLSKDSTGVRKAMLRLMSKDNREVVISEDGIVNIHQFVCWDNLTPMYPMRIPYICEEGVFENRKIILTLIFEKYRAFERGMSSGGTVQTSSDGGQGTSYSGGGGTSYSGGATSTQLNQTDSYTDTLFGKPMQNNSSIQGDYGSVPDHIHYFQQTPRLHYHAMDGHTHGLPAHTHEIGNHTHTINTSHNHSLDYGIFEQDSVCSGVDIYIDGIRYFYNINSDCQVDITQYIKIGKTNKIEIYSATNGRLTVGVYTKSFVGY